MPVLTKRRDESSDAFSIVRSGGAGPRTGESRRCLHRRAGRATVDRTAPLLVVRNHDTASSWRRTLEDGCIVSTKPCFARHRPVLIILHGSSCSRQDRPTSRVPLRAGEVAAPSPLEAIRRRRTKIVLRTSARSSECSRISGLAAMSFETWRLLVWASLRYCEIGVPYRLYVPPSTSICRPAPCNGCASGCPSTLLRSTRARRSSPDRDRHKFRSSER